MRLPRATTVCCRYILATILRNNVCSRRHVCFSAQTLCFSQTIAMGKTMKELQKKPASSFGHAKRGKARRAVRPVKKPACKPKFDKPYFPYVRHGQKTARIRKERSKWILNLKTTMAMNDKQTQKHLTQHGFIKDWSGLPCPRVKCRFKGFELNFKMPFRTFTTRAPLLMCVVYYFFSFRRKHNAAPLSNVARSEVFIISFLLGENTTQRHSATSLGLRFLLFFF